MSNQKTYEIAFRLGASINGSMRSAFANARKNLSNMNSSVGELNEESTGLNKNMGLMKGILGGVAIAASAVGTGLGLAISAVDNYNASMKQIEASTDVSVKKMEEINNIAKNLYSNNFGENWNDLAQSISEVHSVTKLSGKELERASRNALIYRDVFGEEVSQSIKATDTMVKNFGITSDQAFNLLAQGAKKGLNKSDELLDSANEYAPYFQTLGFNANQMFDVFSAGLQSGAFNLFIRAL